MNDTTKLRICAMFSGVAIAVLAATIKVDSALVALAGLLVGYGIGRKT